MNQVILGDALDELKKLPTGYVDLLLTDPPYDLLEFQKVELHQEFLRVCQGDILVFSPPENQWAFEGVKYLFWVKPTSTKNYSKTYGGFVEMVFLYQRGRVWNSGLNWANYVGVYDDKVVGESDHPHEKPASLVERFIRIHSNPGQLMCDPFCGSGTMLHAAKGLGRNYLGIESEFEVWRQVQERLLR